MTREERDGFIANLKYLKSIAQDDGDFVDQTMDAAIRALSIDYDAMIAEIANINAYSFDGKYTGFYNRYDLVHEVIGDVTEIIRKYINAAGDGDNGEV